MLDGCIRITLLVAWSRGLLYVMIKAPFGMTGLEQADINYDYINTWWCLSDIVFQVLDLIIVHVLWGQKPKYYKIIPLSGI